MIGAAKHLHKEQEMLHKSVRVINEKLMELEADRSSTPYKGQTEHTRMCTWTVTGVIARNGRHLLRNSSTVQNVIGLRSEEIEYYAITKRVMLTIGFAKLVCRMESEATTLTAYRFFECRNNCLAKRNWQKHPSRTNEDAVATRT